MYSDKEYSLHSDIPREFLYQRDKVFEEWEIPPWNLLIFRDKLLGEGQFGKVYLASWHKTEVVAKVINEDIPEDKKKLFIKELDVLTKIHHPNVVQVMGYVSDPFIIVMEYLPKGELLEYVQNNTLNIKKKINICLDILRALNYLHNRKPFYIVHRDLKPQNVVMSPSGKAKLADFGISRIFSGESLKRNISLEGILEEDNKENKEQGSPSDLTANVGSPRYMSPEIKSEIKYDYKTDIWSAGIIFAELFENVRYNKNFYWQKSPKDIKNIIITHMLRQEPGDRFNARELITLFEQEKNKYDNQRCCLQ